MVEQSVAEINRADDILQGKESADSVGMTMFSYYSKLVKFLVIMLLIHEVNSLFYKNIQLHKLIDVIALVAAVAFLSPSPTISTGYR